MNILERFWSYVDRSGGPDACWPWTGRVNAKGYGRFTTHGREQVRANRFAFETANPPLEADEFACHRCDNPPCCNPKHLFRGNAFTNAIDMDVKGRGRHPKQKGEANNNVVLTNDDLTRIKASIAAREFNTTIATRFGVHHSTISNIRRGKSWRCHGELNPGYRRERPVS